MVRSKKEIQDELDELNRQLTEAKKQYEDLVAKKPKSIHDIEKIREKVGDLIRLNGLAGNYSELEDLLFIGAEWSKRMGDFKPAKTTKKDITRAIDHYKFERRRRGYQDGAPPDD